MTPRPGLFNKHTNRRGPPRCPWCGSLCADRMTLETHSRFCTGRDAELAKRAARGGMIYEEKEIH